MDTPQQTPPSTASIPPSVSVVLPSGGVGHTTSSHLPPSSSSTPTPLQLLSHHSQHPSLQQFQVAAQLFSSGSLQTTSTSAGVGGVVLSRTNPFISTETSHVTPSALQAASQLQHTMAYSSLNVAVGGVSLQQLQPQSHIQPRTGGLPSYQSGLLPQAVPGGSQSSRSAMASGVAAGMSTYQQAQARQFHGLTGGRGSLSPLSRPPGGPEASTLLPPAKRHAIEYAHHPGVPQHLPPPASVLTQQPPPASVLTQQPPPLGANYVPMNTQGLMMGRAPLASPQMPTVGPSATGFTGDRRGGTSTAAWQQHK